MKKILSIALIVALVACVFSACSALLPEKAILGTWEGSKDIGIISAKYTYTFNEDGSGTMSTPGLDIGVAMNYTIEKDVLKITKTVLGISSTDTYTFAFEKDTLVLTQGDDVVTLTKMP